MTGWTWDYIENNMTVPRLQALEKEWERMPSPTLSLAVLAQAKGMKLKKTRQKNKNVGAALELAQALGETRGR